MDHPRLVGKGVGLLVVVVHAGRQGCSYSVEQVGMLGIAPVLGQVVDEHLLGAQDQFWNEQTLPAWSMLIVSY